MAAGANKLKLARRHLAKVQSAWSEPTDWDDLSLYGFYCLEAAVEAAALHFGLRTSRKHWEKVDLSEVLHERYGLPDIRNLLRDLNEARKATAYGDVPLPEFDAEDLAAEVESYVTAVEALIGRDE